MQRVGIVIHGHPVAPLLRKIPDEPREALRQRSGGIGVDYFLRDERRAMQVFMEDLA